MKILHSFDELQTNNMKLSLFLTISTLLGAVKANFLQDTLEHSIKNLENLITFSQCVRVARDQVFKSYRPITIIGKNIKNLQGLTPENQRVPRRIFEYFGKTSTEHLGRTVSYIIYTKSVEQLTEIFSQVKTTDDKFSEFLIITTLPPVFMANFTHHLQQRGIKQVAVVHDDDPSNKTGHLVHMTSCRALLRNRTKALQIPKYSVKIPKVLKFAVILDGSELSTDFAIENHNNMTLNFEEEVLQLYANKFSIKVKKIKNIKTWKDAYEQLMQEKIHLVCRVLPIFDRETTRIATWSKYDAIYVVSNVPNIKWSSTRILKPFDRNVWLLFLLATICFTIFSIILNLLRSGGSSYDFIRFWAIVRVIMGQGLPRLPNKIGLRLCILMWFLFIFFVSAFYNADYSSHMTSPEKGVLLKTFGDAVKSGRPIGGPRSLIKVLLKDHDPDIIEFVAKYNKHRSSEMTIDETVRAMWENRMIGVINKFMVEMFNWRNRAIYSKKLYHLTHAVVLRGPTYMIVKRHHPLDDGFRKGIKKTINNARLAGIMSKIYEKHYVSKLDNHKANDVSAKSELMIRLEHLEIAFRIVVVGHAIAFKVFLLEICVAKFKK